MPLADSMDGDRSNGLDGKVCRDFLRNVCTRGARCRFRHPADDELQAMGGGRAEAAFCHDFQNKNCSRPNCKFIHCTREEQNTFMETGELPMDVLDVIIERGVVSEVLFDRMSGPICKDFLKGECKRGGKCKFRHITLSNLRNTFGYKASRKRQVSEPEEYPPNGRHCDDFRPTVKTNQTVFYERESPGSSNVRHYRSISNGWCPPEGPPEPKRCHYDTILTPTQQFHLAALHHHHHQPLSLRSLEEENAILLKKVERLEREVNDLKATNEFLLDQNAQLRYCNGRVTTVNSLNTVSVTGVAATTPVASVSVPAAAIAQISQTGAHHTAPTHTAVVATPGAIAGTITPVTISMSQPLTTQPGMPTTTMVPISLSNAVNAIQGPIVSAGTALVTYPAVMTQNIRANGLLSS